MDSFEINKILGAVLATCLGLLSLNIVANAIYHPQKPAKPGYDVAVQEQAPAGGPAPAAAADEPLPKRLASADPARGENAAKKCAACHTFEKGGRNAPGPNLYGIVGRPKASVPGFNYSAALKAKGGNWTPEEIDAFLRSPKGMIPGTNMTFAGVPRGSERADLITYMNAKSDSPAQLPKEANAGPGRQAGIAQP